MIISELPKTLMATVHDSLTHGLWGPLGPSGLAVNTYPVMPPKGYTVSPRLPLLVIATNARMKEAALCKGYLFFLDFFILSSH